MHFKVYFTFLMFSHYLRLLRTHQLITVFLKAPKQWAIYLTLVVPDLKSTVFINNRLKAIADAI